MVEVSRASLSLESSSESESELSAILGDEDLCKTTYFIKTRSYFHKWFIPYFHFTLVNGRIHEGQGFIHILQVFTKYDNTDILDQITLAPFSTMKISLEYQNYNIFVLALKDLVNGIYGLFFYAGTNQNRFLASTGLLYCSANFYNGCYKYIHIYIYTYNYIYIYISICI